MKIPFHNKRVFLDRGCVYAYASTASSATASAGASAAGSSATSATTSAAGWLRAELVAIANCALLLGGSLYPSWDFKAFALEETNDTVRWLCTIFQIKSSLILGDISSFAVWIVVAKQGKLQLSHWLGFGELPEQSPETGHVLYDRYVAYE